MGMSTMTCSHMRRHWCGRKYGDRLWFCHPSSMSTAFCLSTLTPSSLPPSLTAPNALSSLFLFVKIVLNIYNIKVTMLILHFKKKNIIYVSKCCLCLCAHVCAGACRGQQRALRLLQLELKVVVSCIVWRLRMNSSPFQEQRALLTSHPALRLHLNHAKVG